LEETLDGDEISFILAVDGERYASLVPTRDHKRIFDGNRGPNTGGMGAFSTDELLSPQLRDSITQTIVEPTLRGLSADGIRYQGFLFIGLMVTADGPKVLEFNCRLGDPETQAILARLDCDLAEILLDLASRRFEPSKFRWKSGASVCVVMASEGYPGKLQSAKPISGLTGVSKNTGVKVLHAGTRLIGDVVVTSGGRVLGITATGPTLEAAVASAYAAQTRSNSMACSSGVISHASRLRPLCGRLSHAQGLASIPRSEKAPSDGISKFRRGCCRSWFLWLCSRPRVKQTPDPAR